MMTVIETMRMGALIHVPLANNVVTARKIPENNVMMVIKNRVMAATNDVNWKYVVMIIWTKTVLIIKQAPRTMKNVKKIVIVHEARPVIPTVIVSVKDQSVVTVE